ncbi:hypothetical protein Tco_0047265 [Tanacetum coccineum]
MGSHSPIDEGIRKSKPLPEGKPTEAKDLEGNKQPANKGLPAIVLDEGISKTKPLPERTKTDPKDSERIKPLTARGSSTLPVTALLGTDAEYQTSSEVDLDFEPMFLATIFDIQALLGSSDDELKEDSDDDVFEVGEEIDEDIQEPNTEETQTHHSTETPTKEPHSQEHQSPSPPKEQHESSKAKKTNASDSRSSLDTLEEHKEVVASYVDLRAAIEGYYEEDVDHIAQTDKLSLNKVFDTLEADSALKEAMQQMAESNDLARLLRNAKLPKLLTHVTMQDDIVFIKGMVTGMFQAFKGISTSTLSGSASVPTVTQPEGEKMLSKETTKEAEIEHVEKESEVEDVVMEPVQEPQFTGPVIDITLPPQLESPQATPKPDRGKGKVTDNAESQPKLVKASKIPAHSDKEEKIEQAAKEALLSKPELIKVVHEEATKAGFDRKILASAKGGQEFRKIQDAEIKCNRSLPKGILFVNNLMIEQFEYEIFFIDVFGDKDFQKMSDIHKVDIETLLTYLVMASNISTLSNQKFCLALRRLIESHPDQEKFKSKKVNLESVGYKLD